MISFLLGSTRVNLEEVDPNITVLRWLRGIGRVGTGEGCASGDCGACTGVLVAPDPDDRRGLDHRATTACITLLASLDGHPVLAVEGLADPDTEALHPVRHAHCRRTVVRRTVVANLLTRAVLEATTDHPVRVTSLGRR